MAETEYRVSAKYTANIDTKPEYTPTLRNGERTLRTDANERDYFRGNFGFHRG